MYVNQCNHRQLQGWRGSILFDRGRGVSACSHTGMHLMSILFVPAEFCRSVLVFCFQHFYLKLTLLDSNGTRYRLNELVLCDMTHDQKKAVNDGI